MGSVLLLFPGITGMLFGWFAYSKFLAEKVFRLDPVSVTPARSRRDSVDFVPANKVVLCGHHLNSVAGASIGRIV